MSSTRHDRISALFSEARRLAPDLRTEFLARACGADHALRSEVESLLAELSASDTALDPSAYAREIGDLAAGAASPSPDAVEEGPGTTVGRYRLLQEIGEGGFGRVYVAEQTEPVVRRVALKIIKLGMDTRQVIARFEAERQALAMMDHASIAKVFDAGATATGRPYFVMELVRGVPITEYCDANRLDTEQRVSLFMDVCAAVQHAHQKGIIHRDLKPSNVLVELRESGPVPKVIDFGIAKAMNQKLTEKTIFTEYRQFVGTPQYTSPEQAEMSGLDIDTRSDVYALGVLLYELMTGATPFDSKRLRFAGFGEIQRIIREEDPAKPSTRVTTADAAEADSDTRSVDEVARLRRTDPATLRRTLRGDLDWIVMKAVEKDRTRRYDTASDLAQDLRRYLGYQPVLAGPPSAVYRFRKFARRNRTAMGIAVAAALALTAGLAIAAVGFYEASQERDAAQSANAEATAARDESEAVTAFLTEMLAAVDPRNEGDDVTVRALLDAAGDRVRTEFADQPVIAARLRHTIGMTYGALGLFAPAEDHLKAAVDLRLRTLGEESSATRDSMNELAFIYHYQERLDDAEPLYVRAREASLRFEGPESEQALSIAGSLASVYRYREQFEKAQQLYEEVLPTLREHYPKAEMTVTTISNYGVMCFQQKRYEESTALLEEALALRRELFGEAHPSTLSSLANLASTYRQQGRLEEAAELLRAAIAGEREALPEDHWYRGDTLSRYGALLAELGDYERAEAAFDEGYPLLVAALGEDHPRVRGTRGRYAKLYELWGKPDKAEAWRGRDEEDEPDP